MKISEHNAAIAIHPVGISIIERVAIIITAPTSAPTTAAVIPSTKFFTDLFFAIFLKYELQRKLFLFQLYRGLLQSPATKAFNKHIVEINSGSRLFYQFYK